MLVAMHHCHRNLLGLTVDVKVGGRRVRRCGRVFNSCCATSPPSIAAMSRCVSDRVRLAAGGGDTKRRDRQLRRGRARGPRRESRSEPLEPIRVADPVSFRLVPCMDLCAGAAHRVRRSESARHPAVAAANAATGESRRAESRGEEDFAGLRSYAPGIPLKHMASEDPGARRRGGRPDLRRSGSAARTGSSGPRSTGSMPRRASRSSAAGSPNARPVSPAPTDFAFPGSTSRPAAGPLIGRDVCARWPVTEYRRHEARRALRHPGDL